MKYDSRGIAATVIFHILLILILVFMGFRTPLPLPSEKGFLIDFGENEWGNGESEPQKEEIEKIKIEQVQHEKVEEVYATQDFEDAPSIPDKNEKKKTEQKQVVEKVIQKKVVIPKKQKEERNPNPLTLYKGSSESSKSNGQGSENKQGNTGREDGDAGSHFIGKAGAMGVADVGDRVATSLPNPEYNYQKEGVVVVKVRVDKRGNVVYALPGVQGSTTLENYLLEVAKKAAMASKFDPRYDGGIYDEGIITYRFKLK